MSNLLPPLEAISSENQGPAVVTVGYVLIVITIVVVLIRVATTFTSGKKFGVDDGFLVLATALGLAETILIERTADSGLGRHISTLSLTQLRRYYEFTYASGLLAIVTMASAKMSTLLLMRRLSTQNSGMHRYYYIIGASIALWTVFSVLAIALECSFPSPWEYSPQRCTGRAVLWYLVIIFNILTDAVLACVLAPMLWKLQMQRSQRISVICLFAIRLSVCIAAIIQLVLLAPALTAADQTRANIAPAIAAQCVMNLSIITAATPSLHRFLADLQTSRMAAQIPNTQYELSQSNSGSAWKVFSKSSKSVNKSHNAEEKHDDGKPDFHSEVDMNRTQVLHDPAERTGLGSRTSDGSEEMIIRQTIAWDVSYDDVAGSGMDVEGQHTHAT